MYDLHAHILSGLDDGANNINVSLAMALLAERTGTRVLIATPHVIEGGWMPDWGEIVAGCGRLQQSVRQADGKISILPGAEVAMSPGILKRLLGPGAYCINGGRYLLIELPSAGIPLYADEFFFKIQVRGMIPILVHPERHLELMGNLELLESWINRGVLVQLNGPSLTGHFGKQAKKTAEILLKRGLVYCIGSDAHHDVHRSTNLAAERARIQELIGFRAARRILSDNPEYMINSLGAYDNGQLIHKV